MQTPERYISGKATLLVTGEFNRGDVTSTPAEASRTFTPTDEQTTTINEGWQRVTDRNPSAFPGPLVAIPHYAVTANGQLAFRWGKSDFREWAGAGQMTDLVAGGYDGTPNPISTNTVLYTREGDMVIGIKTSGDATGELVTFGGMGHPEADLNDAGNYDPFNNAARKARGEFGFEPELTLAGLAYQAIDLRDKDERDTTPEDKDLGRCGPVALFIAKTNLPAAEVLSQHAPEADGELIVVDRYMTPTQIAEYVGGTWTAESALNVEVAQGAQGARGGYTQRRLLVPPQRVSAAMRQ